MTTKYLAQWEKIIERNPTELRSAMDTTRTIALASDHIFTMGGQQSTNGTDAYKVDIFGESMRKKFDKGELKVTDTHLCFVGAKNNFEWPLGGFKRFGLAKKVFSVELLDFNDVLNTREIIFRSKSAHIICEDFREKLTAMEQRMASQPETTPMIEAVS